MIEIASNNFYEYYIDKKIMYLIHQTGERFKNLNRMNKKSLQN